MKSTRPKRLAVAKRDGWTCYYCGVPLSDDPSKPDQADDRPQLEHKIPECKGGTWDLSNLVLSCRHCNTYKRQMTDEEFKDRLEHVWRYRDWCSPKQRKIIPPYWL